MDSLFMCILFDVHLVEKSNSDSARQCLTDINHNLHTMNNILSYSPGRNVQST